MMIYGLLQVIMFKNNEQTPPKVLSKCGTKPKLFLFVLRINVPVNNFSVMSGQSQLFLGLTSTVGS